MEFRFISDQTAHKPNNVLMVLEVKSVKTGEHHQEQLEIVNATASTATMATTVKTFHLVLEDSTRHNAKTGELSVDFIPTVTVTVQKISMASQDILVDIARLRFLVQQITMELIINPA